MDEFIYIYLFLISETIPATNDGNSQVRFNALDKHS